MVLFDLDETLVTLFKDTLLPGVAEWFAQRPAGLQVGIVTNQGGVGCRYRTEVEGWSSGGFPTKEEVDGRIARVLASLGVPNALVYRSFAYYSPRTDRWWPTPPEGHPWYEGGGAWSHQWRKPDVGMIKAAVFDTLLPYGDVVVVGDSLEDKQAAESLGVDFVWAWDFFGRPSPEDSIPF